LDRDTSGLLLLTNDGQLANQILHPRYQIDKQYVVQLAHAVTASDSRRLLGGLFLDDGPVRLTRLESLSKNRYRVVIAQGRNRIIRRLFDTLGYRVINLHRDTIGPIQLGRLAVGQVDALNYQKTLTMIMETDG
jgi:23S rRNA pseudouridine2605 synthase